SSPSAVIRLATAPSGAVNSMTALRPKWSDGKSSWPSPADDDCSGSVQIRSTDDGRQQPGDRTKMRSMRFDRPDEVVMAASALRCGSNVYLGRPTNARKPPRQ